MNYAELIQEAERRIRELVRNPDNEQLEWDPITARLLARLAAALRECAPPEGWTATEYVKSDVYTLKAPRVAQTSTGLWVTSKFAGHKVEYPTASAAMAAMVGEGK